METNPTNTGEKETIWSVPFVILMAMGLFQSLASYMSNTILPLYIDHFGAAASVIGIIVGASAATAVASRPFAGPAFDSFPRRILLGISQLICGAAVLLYGFVDSTEQLIVLRLLLGIGMGGVGPLAMSLVSELLPASKMASGMSIFSVSQSVAQVAGPATGLWLSTVIGYSNVFILSGAVVIVVTFGLILVPEKDRERPPYQLRIDRIIAPEALDKGFVLMMLLTSFSCVSAYLVLYSRQVGVEDVSLYFVVYALCLIATRPLFGSLADRFGTRKMLLVGIACFASSFVILSQVHDFAGFMVVAVVSSLGYGVSTPLVQSLVMTEVPLERRGAGSNTAYLGLDMGNLLGPTIAGFMIDRIHSATGSLLTAYSSIWLIMLVPIAIAFAVVIRWNVKNSQK